MYKKILIKSEEDLPEEISIKYFVMYKDGTYCKDKRINPFDPVSMQVWTSFVDWYLIESPISVPTEEDIETQADEYSLFLASDGKYHKNMIKRATYYEVAKLIIDEIIKRNK